MLKPHCDNCNGLIVDAATTRIVNVQPHGYNCIVRVTIEKAAKGTQELCRACLRSAIREFADQIGVSDPSVVPDTVGFA